MISKKSTSGKNIPQTTTQDFATILWNTSTKIFLDRQDRFLRTFNTNFFNNKTIISDIEEAVKKGAPIGQPSAMGTNLLVTTDEGVQYVVKTSVICPSNIDKLEVFKKTLCSEARLGDVIFRVPSIFDKKQILLAPNYFTESLIGILLSSDNIKKYTPSFPKVYGFQYDSSSTNVYTVMEPLKPVIPLLETSSDVLYYIFQITNALYVAQKLGRYTHYDLHSGNLLSKPKRGDMVRVYELNNGSYLYTLFDFDVKLIDFGMNRMETKEGVIIPKVKFNPGGTTLPDYFNGYEFNPYYDLFTAIYFPLYYTHPDAPKVPLNKRDLFIIRDLLISSFLNIKNERSVLDTHINRILLSNGNWRPNPNALGDFDPSKGVYQPCTPENYMSVIAGIIQNATTTLYPDLDTNNLERVASVIEDTKLIVLDRLVDLSGIGKIVSSQIHPLIPKKECMDTTYYSTLLSDGNPKVMNYISIESRTIGGNYIHIATIDQVNGTKKGGYNFRFDCCRVDIRNFLRNSSIKSGVAINASFFNINSDFSPIGYFSTPDITVKNKIPSIYRDSYGMVGIGKDGLLSLKMGVSEENTGNFDQVLTVGPVLLWGGKVIMTEDKLNEVTDNIYKFRCVQPPAGQDKNERYYVDNKSGSLVPNCTKIKPGELSHAGEVNPRSAIAVNRDNGNVYFIYVEGRNKRGIGVTLNELANICKNTGATDAINLDGGGSSQMVWREPGYDVITQTNPDHNFAYPVGNIISFIREK